MPFVGFSGVANQANTTDGFAQGAGAANVPVTDNWGQNVGDGGVVDLYHNGLPIVTAFILMESTGYVLQESGNKIVLESS